MELGHLYDDREDQRALIIAAINLGLASRYMQGAETGVIHFDLWGKPLLKAKKIYLTVTDEQFAEDIKKVISGVTNAK